MISMLAAFRATMFPTVATIGVAAMGPEVRGQPPGCLPDLVVSSMTVAPASPVPVDANYRVQIVITNPKPITQIINPNPHDVRRPPNGVPVPPIPADASHPRDEFPANCGTDVTQADIYVSSDITRTRLGPVQIQPLLNMTCAPPNISDLVERCVIGPLINGGSYTLTYNFAPCVRSDSLPLLPGPLSTGMSVSLDPLNKLHQRNKNNNTGRVDITCRTTP